MKTLLLVDDEHELVGMLGEMLEEDGYKVIAATNGEDCLRKVQLAKPDLIILDVMMPKMDGAEAFSRLRQNKKTEHIPIIFLTALKDEVNNVKMGQHVGNYTIFSKPFDHDELLGTIREMTSEP